MIGRVLSGRYVVEAVVGTGGMAVVYRAYDRVRKQTVALKVLRPEYESDHEFVRRFSREAEAASKVSHENIANSARRRHRRRRALHRHGVRRRADAQGHDPRAGADQARSGAPDDDPHPRGGGPRPSQRHRPPRHQAPEHPGRPAGPRQGGRLRHRPAQDRADDDASTAKTAASALGSVHYFLARAGARRGRRREERPLFRRRRALRDAHRARAVRRRDVGLRRAQARQRGAEVHAPVPERHLQGAGRGGHARAVQGRLQALSDRGGDGGRPAPHDHPSARRLRPLSARPGGGRAAARGAPAQAAARPAPAGDPPRADRRRAAGCCAWRWWSAWLFLDRAVSAERARRGGA